MRHPTTSLAATSLHSADSSAFAPTIHHAAVKTRNITTAIEFYSLFGFEVTTKFRAGPARAAWLEQQPREQTNTTNAILELIEIPPYLLQEPDGQRRRALNLMERQELLGHNHLALDVTEYCSSSLSVFLEALKQTSRERFDKTILTALSPRQQLIGRSVYELAYIYDADGALIELLRYESTLDTDMDSGWDPWNGQGFSGPDSTATNPDETRI